MRRFDDHDGQGWEAVLGRESWGVLFAIFIPVGGPKGLEMRQAPLAVASHDEATRVFEALDETGLRALLERSEPKTL